MNGFSNARRSDGGFQGAVAELGRDGRHIRF